MIGYTHNGYRLWNPIHRKLVTAKNVIFDEKKNIEDIKNKTVNMKTTWIDSDNEQIEETEETNDEEFADTLSEIQNSTEEETEGNKDSDEYDKSKKNTRKSTRIRKPLVRYEDCDMAHLALSAESFVNEVSLKIAKTRSDYKYWKSAVDEEIKALKKNNTWTLVKKPKNAKIIDSSKWVFRLKRYPDDQIKEYKAYLVAKGFIKERF